MRYEIIKHNNKSYAVFEVKFKEYKLPVVVDYDDFKIIRDIEKSWKCNKSGLIYCTHTHSKTNITKDIFIHNVIMNLKNKDSPHKILNKPIIHLSTLSLDNRRDNLIYDIPEKEKNKNVKKKKRTITLPKSSGIIPDDIPTYVWYMKPETSHGERFMVSVGDIVYKTTSSKETPLKDKLEQAKTYLRNLKSERPDLFESYSMNGDLNKDGKQLYESYFDIINKAGYDYIEKSQLPNLTPKLLRADRKPDFYPLDSLGSEDNSDDDQTTDSEYYTDSE